MVYDPDSNERASPFDVYASPIGLGAQAVSKVPDQNCSDDDAGDWDELDESAEPLDSLDFLDDSEPEPEYGDFWFEDNDWEDR